MMRAKTNKFYMGDVVKSRSPNRRLFVLILWLLPIASLSQNCDAQPVFKEQNRAVKAAVNSIAPFLLRFETIGGLERVEGQQVNIGPSTGVIISEDGFAISAAVNFANEPTAIFARLPDGKKIPAEIIARDFSRNLVLLKLQSGGSFDVPTFCNRADLQIGQTAIAIGRVYDKTSPNVSTGIISATNRIWGKAIQTDAKISPANFGGPLIDLHGKLIGVLVPLSPDDDSVSAGGNWYDSGIGFAIPILEIGVQIEKMKTGVDLRAGQLGISLKGSDIYSDAAEIAYAPSSSPAWKAGLRPLDTIVQLNGKSIVRQSQLKHALGPLYENDVVKIVIVRDGVRKNFEVELAGEIEPYRPTSIGILPDVGVSESQTVRYVFPESAADNAGILLGDVVKKIDGQLINTWNEVRQKIAILNKGQSIQIEVERKGKSSDTVVAIDHQNADLPIELKSRASDERNPADVEVVNIQVSESANQCFAIVPPNSQIDIPCSVLVWVPQPGKVDSEDFTNHWRKVVADRNLIVLVPQSLNADRWLPDETEFITKSLLKMGTRYSIDRSSMVVGGRGSGGSMAALVANENRVLIRGLLLIDCGLPNRVKKIETSAVNRLLVFSGTTPKFESGRGNARLLKQLRNSNLPFIQIQKNSDRLSDWVTEIATWVDSVNRM